MNNSKKTDKKLTGLPKLKTQLWLASVIEGSHQVSLEKTLYWLYEKGLEGDSNKWYRYSSCSSTPRPELIAAVDKILPGTAKIYRSGSERFPLFLVLEKNEGACKRVVSSLLADARLYQSEKSVAEKCRTLLQYMVEYQFEEAWCGSPVDLDKLVVSPTNNAIAKSYKDKNLNRRTVLAIVALWILAQSGEDPKAINYTDYFLLGILYEPLTDNFGKLIAEFIQEMYREAG
ncbi:hypothetical protein RGU72_13035 [Undibacterium sp. 5I1]|uniref:hypothetical protein n=1 Tax=unclassified Undibacterium TaxID=2630295 RepID=UPI002AB4FDE2|nr:MULTISPECIES: hypothetical protein [unclassified Undibacterium]MDY7539178.1 hypothetical protein [Undibacterium sp. 5I1]MEB0233264.1 hypothetical protein [Undibacterium sp. 10I3]MEB0257024.1 hypothetical protein [Undibacterium sp. 5I1]